MRSKPSYAYVLQPSLSRSPRVEYCCGWETPPGSVELASELSALYVAVPVFPNVSRLPLWSHVAVWVGLVPWVNVCRWPAVSYVYVCLPCLFPTPVNVCVWTWKLLSYVYVKSAVLPPSGSVRLFDASVSSGLNEKAVFCPLGSVSCRKRPPASSVHAVVPP